ncbi:WcaG Nucleoside-diphosphate-sugar epimerases [actinobacterium SCGC AAA044-D11]
MRFLVTGGAGHLGSNLINKLGQLEGIEEIVVVDNMSTQRYGSFFNLPFKSKIKLKVGDVRELSVQNSMFDRPFTAVIHLSALTDASHSLVEPKEIFANNFGSTDCLIDICSKLSIPFIFPSSTSIYHPKSTEKKVDEEALDILGLSPYSDCKIREENAIRKLSGTLQFCILRLGTIFGVSQGMRFHTAVNKFCWQASIGEELTVWKTALNQTRPYLSVNDFSSAITHIITNEIYRNQTYNLVTCNEPVTQILEYIEKFSGTRPKIKFTESKLMNDLSFEVLNQKFKDTNFSFEGNLEIEISETMELLRGLRNA